MGSVLRLQICNRGYHDADLLNLCDLRNGWEARRLNQPIMKKLRFCSEGLLLLLFCLFFPACSSAPPEFTTEVTDDAVVERKVIRSAEMTLAVEDLTEGFEFVRSRLKGWEGFLSSSNLQASENGHGSAYLEMRVPSSDLDEVLKQIGQAGEVVSLVETGEDVTDSYVDLQSQLRNLKVSEQRLLELLSHTASVKDLLEAEKEVTRTRGEIERIEGQIKQMDHRVDFAAVRVQFLRQAPEAAPNFWRIGETASGAWSMLMHIVRTATWCLIYLLALIPVGLPLWFLMKRNQKS